jgi:hypothetical protein
MSELKPKTSGTKKILIGLALALVLAIIDLPLIDRNFKSSLKPELKNFAVENPDAVTKIFLANKTGNTLTLEKKEGGSWILNGDAPANDEKVNMLLYEYMARIRVKNPIPKDGVENVKRQLAAIAIKVEVYEGDKLSKTYYVGGNTADELGTYMYIEGSSVPFVVHIPGFMGYVSSVYTLDEKRWRSTKLFQTSLLDLKSVVVDYPGNEKNGFTITKEDKNVLIEPLSNEKKPDLALNKEFLKQYTATFENLHFESYFDALAKTFADSVIQATKVPFARIAVTDKNNKTTALRIYKKPVTSETKFQYDAYGNEVDYDLDRFYGILNNKTNEVFSVQSFVFKNVLKNYSDFFE